MNQLSTALSLLAASQLALFLVMLILSDNPKRVKFSGGALMLGIILYLILPLIDLYYGVATHAIFWFPSAIAASMLLVFVWFVFEEQECRIPKGLLALVAISISGSLYFSIINVGLPGAPIWFQVLKLVIVVVALVTVSQGQDNDLVEQRFHARRLFISILATVMLAVMAIEVFARFNTGSGLEIVQKGVIFIFAISFNVYFLRQNSGVQLIPETAPIQEESKDPVLARLLDKMRTERLYADHDLRVAGLADMMGIPEYQLRSKINQGLGYRNFNQFVNRYRIEEAGERLMDNIKTPVLTVALEVGFRSISSFNTAFQAEHGVSPTQFRLRTKQTAVSAAKEG